MKIKRRLRFQSHRGVLDAGIIILGGVVAVIAIIAATLAWSDILEVSFIHLVTDMPKFGYDVTDGHETGNQNFEMYVILRNIAFFILLFVLMFAGLSFMFEHINFVPPDTAYQILSKSLIYIFFFFFFPPLWDLMAVAVEQTSLWILNPDDQSMPTKNVEFLLTKLSRIDSPNFTLDAVVAGISDPFGVLKNLFLSIFLSAFKAIAFLIFMFVTFLVGTIRIILTAIVTVAIPVLLMLSLLPFFRRITGRFIDALLGLLIAPIFSALVIIAGVAHLHTLESSSPDPVVEWFAALAVMSLATFMPAMIAPMLGSVMSSVSSFARGAISTSASLTGMAGIGMARSVGGVLSDIKNERMTDAVTNPLDLTKMVFSRSSLTPIAEQNEPRTTPKSVGMTHGPYTTLLKMGDEVFIGSQSRVDSQNSSDDENRQQTDST